MAKIAEKTFWITNYSKMNVTLADLYISVPSMSSINLLDKKHYNFTEEQLIKSAQSGSLFKKRDKISVRLVPPPVKSENKTPSMQNDAIPSRGTSIYEIKYENYEELDVSSDDPLIEGEKLKIVNTDTDNKKV